MSKFQIMTFTSEETANNVKEQLDNGADFSTLAKSYSEDSYKGETRTYSNSDKYLPSSVMKEVYKLHNGSIPCKAIALMTIRLTTLS